MIDSYWDLYVAYVHKCVENNWKNDIDPAHYEMDWNHTLPKCIFGDQPIGQWLTLKQHAIASALQTLAFNRNCLFGGHKQHLPEKLLEKAWPLFCTARQEGAKVTHTDKDSLGRSIHGVRSAKKLNSERDNAGRSINAVKGGRKAAELFHKEKDNQGRSVNAVKAGKAIHKEKDDQGRSKHAVKMGKKGAKATNKKKDSRGRSINAVKGSEAAHKEKDSQGRSINAVKNGHITALRTQKGVQLIRIEDGEVFIFESITFAAKVLQIPMSSIVRVCQGKRKTAKGFTATYWGG